MSEGIPPDGDDGFIGDDDYRSAFGEALDATLDLRTWELGLDPKHILKRFKEQELQLIEGKLGQLEVMKTARVRDIQDLKQRIHETAADE